MFRFLTRPFEPKRRLILLVMSLQAVVIIVCGALNYQSYGHLAAVFVGLVAVAVAIVLFNEYEGRLTQANSSLEDMVAQRTESLIRHRDALIFGLAELAHSRDDDTGAHLTRIRQYVEILAKRLWFSEEEAVRMGLESSLHDIGKVGIPDCVLLKPGKLTDDERKIIQKHALIGGECLLAVRELLGETDDFLEGACEIALAHHEWWNGNGYPYGLVGEKIPMIARIVAVADVYDALTSDRPYKKAFSHEKSRAIILDSNGTQFDPEVVRAFLDCEEQFLRIAQSHGDAVSENGHSALRDMVAVLS